MTMHRPDLTKGLPLPSTVVRALMEFVGSLVTNFKLDLASNTVLRVPAGTGDDQMAIAIDGKWRWVSAPVTASHPGGAAGAYEAWVTAYDNDLSLPDPADATNYAFALTIIPAGGTIAPSAATALQRQVAKLQWDGSKITQVTPLVAAPSGLPITTPTVGQVPVTDASGNLAWKAVGQVPVGGIIAYAGATEPGVTEAGTYLFADGRLVDTATYPTFFAQCGHAYNGGVDPGGGKCRLPDKRGRSIVGQDNMGTAQGAAGRLPNSNRARGQNGGEEMHALTANESGLRDHAHGHNLGVAAEAGHTHGIFPGNYVPGSGNPFGVVAVNGGSQYIVVSAASVNNGLSTGAGSAHAHSLGGGVLSSGASAAINSHNNMHPYEVDNVIVRVA